MQENLSQIKSILESDGILYWLSDTVWALACLNTKQASQKIFQMKKRDTNKHLQILISQTKQIKQFFNYKLTFSAFSRLIN